MNSVRKSLTNRRRVSVLGSLVVLVLVLSYTVFVYLPDQTRQVAYAASDDLAAAVPSALVAAQTRFGLNLFRVLAAEEAMNS